MLREELIARFPRLRDLPSNVYVVGGAIRDLLHGVEPADVDIAAHDALAAAESLGRKVIRLGKEHLSAWRVVDGEHVYDFAPIDGTIDTDLARRDFTINAMAVPLAGDAGFLDPNGGREDLRARRVRMVRASNFDDDPLRMVKGVRMAVRYDFTMDGATVAAIRERARQIFEVAPERVTYELSLIFSAGRFRKALELLQECGLDAPLFGRTFETQADDVPLAGAMALLVDDPRSYAEKWKWSENLLRDVLALRRLLEQHDRMALFDAGEEVARQLAPTLRAMGRDDALDLPDFSIEPLLGGNEIAALTALPPGPELGKRKRALLEAQVRGDVRTREEAESFVRRLSPRA